MIIIRSLTEDGWDRQQDQAQAHERSLGHGDGSNPTAFKSLKHARPNPPPWRSSGVQSSATSASVGCSDLVTGMNP